MALLSFERTQALLGKYKLPFVPTVASRDPKEVLHHGLRLGYPLVLKGVGGNIIHKTEKGLVYTSITCREQLQASLDELWVKILDDPDAQILLQKQLKGAELIVGAKRDDSFGPVVVFGTGGVYAELLDDVSTRVCPLGREDVRQMIRETQARKFLSGFRGVTVSERAIEKLVLGTSDLMLENEWVKEIDFNPVIAKGDDAVIVDARVVI